jgi:hypothetical protein
MLKPNDLLSLEKEIADASTEADMSENLNEEKELDKPSSDDENFFEQIEVGLSGVNEKTQGTMGGKMPRDYWNYQSSSTKVVDEQGKQRSLSTIGGKTPRSWSYQKHTVGNTNNTNSSNFFENNRYAMYQDTQAQSNNNMSNNNTQQEPVEVDNLSDENTTVTTRSRNTTPVRHHQGSSFSDTYQMRNRGSKPNYKDDSDSSDNEDLYVTRTNKKK